MNWEALGAIGEIVGAAGVIATLVYLSVQLRQNTKALRSNAWQSIQDSEQRFDDLFSSNPQVCEVWMKGNKGGLDALESEAERFQFTSLAKQLIDQFQTHHYQHERGLIETELWETWVTQFTDDVVNYQGFRQVLEQRRKHLRPSFNAFIEQYVGAKPQ